MTTVGPWIGGLLMAAVGAAGALVADAASFVASAVAVSRVLYMKPRRPRMGRRSVRLAIADLGEGWRTQRSLPLCEGGE